MADAGMTQQQPAELADPARESVKTVQARLGLASAPETLDTYSHLWPDSDDRTRAAVDSVLRTAEDCRGLLRTH